MLSAFAARQAAKAASEDNTGHSKRATSKPVSSENSKRVPKSEKAAKPPSTSAAPRSAKRSSSSAAESTTPKKRKRGTRPSAGTTISAVDAFGQQDDMIVVPPDSDDEDSENSDINIIVDLPEEPAPAPRAWSPSAPALEDVPLAPTASIPHPPDILSTYEPIPDQNIYLVDPQELSIGASVTSAASSAFLLLDEGTRACFVGNYNLTTVKGAVILAGTRLRASPVAHRVFAPTSSPLPVIKAVADDQPAMPVPARLQCVVEKASCVVLIQSLITGVEGLQRVCQRFEGVFTPRAPARLVPGFHNLYLVHEPSRDTEIFTLPPTWTSSMDEIGSVDSSVTLVKGPKKCGKSTAARTLVNKQLEKFRRVAFLECDIGQSEFIPAGMVALNVVSHPVFGPPFTHPTIPYRAHYIGETTPKSSPAHYLAAIEALVETYRLDLQTPALDEEDEDEGAAGGEEGMIDGSDERITDHIPLIVNTMGWTKGLGADLLRRIEDIVQPTHMLEFEAATDFAWPRAANEYAGSGALPERLHTSKTLRLTPVVPLYAETYTAADHRTLSILSYFHAEFPEVLGGYAEEAGGSLKQLTARTWNVARPLVAQLPYEVDVAQAVDAVVLMGAGAEDVPRSEVARVLNGAVVGLVVDEGGLVDVEADDVGEGNGAIPYAQGASPPSPSASHCIGLALVRGYSSINTSGVTQFAPPTLQLLTPVPPALLGSARVLAKGSLELPVWGMLDWTDDERVTGVEHERVPYLQWGKGDGIGAERRRVRRNLMRKAQG
ncbi:hypothetical protein FB107DRAFT_271127 [Schizophyllum commune]